MIHDNTHLIKALLEGHDAREIIRIEIEDAVNFLLKTELTEFLSYEKHDISGYNTGNSRNGYYERTISTNFGDITVQVPRDRNGGFQNQTLPQYKRSVGDLETTIIHLYRNGISNAEVADLIYEMYGKFYSRQSISNITKVVSEHVEAFHNRPIPPKYTVVYCDATFFNLRRDTVSREALHLLLGITPEGLKEIIDFTIAPQENVLVYKDMLERAGFISLEIFNLVSVNVTGKKYCKI